MLIEWHTSSRSKRSILVLLTLLKTLTSHELCFHNLAMKNFSFQGHLHLRCRNILWSKKLKWYHHTGDRSDRKYLKEHAEGYKIIAIIANLKTLEYRSAWQKSKSESHSGSIRIENLLFSILTWNIFFRKRGEVSVKRKASFCTFYCWHMITAALSAGNLSTKTWQYRLPRFLPWYLL